MTCSRLNLRQKCTMYRSRNGLLYQCNKKKHLKRESAAKVLFEYSLQTETSNVSTEVLVECKNALICKCYFN